jgi:hypothetical protein
MRVENGNPLRGHPLRGLGLHGVAASHKTDLTPFILTMNITITTCQVSPDIFGRSFTPDYFPYLSATPVGSISPFERIAFETPE